MNELLSISIIQLLMAILLGISVMYLTYAYLHNKVALKKEIKNDNVAFSIFSGGVLFAVAYLLQGVISPIIAVTRIFSTQLSGFKLYLATFQYAGIFVFIGLTLAVFIILISVKLFTMVTTDIDEFEELKKNNIAVGITTAVIIIGIAMLSKESMEMLIDALVPLPELPTIS